MALIINYVLLVNHNTTACGTQVLDRVLESTPFQFSVELAAIAARRDFLNLEKWLQDNLTIHRDSFFQVGIFLSFANRKFHVVLNRPRYFPGSIVYINLLDFDMVELICMVIFGF